MSHTQSTISLKELLKDTSIKNLAQSNDISPEEMYLRMLTTAHQPWVNLFRAVAVAAGEYLIVQEIDDAVAEANNTLEQSARIAADNLEISIRSASDTLEASRRVDGDAASVSEAARLDGSVVKRFTPPRKENLVWSATDITNGYKDLRFWAAPDSVQLSTSGVVRTEGVDYNVIDPDKTFLTCPADVAGSLQGTFFKISSSTVNYAVWFNVDGLGVAPASSIHSSDLFITGAAPVAVGTARTLVAVAISSNASASAIASAVATALKGLSSGAAFHASSSSNIVTVNPIVLPGTYPYLTAAADFNSGVTFSVENSNIRPSRIVLLAGGALITGGSAALVANSSSMVSYHQSLDPIMPYEITIPNMPWYTQAEVDANPGAGISTTVTNNLLKLGEVGEPIFCIPGRTADRKAHMSAMRDLAERYQVYSWQSPYSSSLPKPDDGTLWSEELYARNINGILKAIGKGQKVNVLASSIGAKHMVLAMNMEPGLVKSIVFLDPFFAAHEKVGNQLIQPLDDYLTLFNPTEAAIQMADYELSQYESFLIMTGQHSAPFASLSEDQRVLSSGKYISDWALNASTVDPIRSFDDPTDTFFTGTRTYYSAFRSTFTPTLTTNPTAQGTIDQLVVAQITHNLFSQSQKTIIKPYHFNIFNGPNAVPMMFFNGALTRRLQSLTGEALASYVPSAKRVVVPGVAHSMTGAAQFALIVVDILTFFQGVK